MHARAHTRQSRSRLSRARVVLALAAVVTAFGLSPESSAARPLPDGYFGTNAQYLFPFFPPWTVDAHLDAMRSGGMETVRTDALWHEVEPDPPVAGIHDYRWERLDRQVGEMARHGLRWLPIVDYSAAWASSVPGRTTAPPASVAAYAEYARAIAARYGRGGVFWREHPEVPALPVTAFEIWNEPNHDDFWVPGADPAAYAELYAGARAAIRSVDADAQVIVGGLNGPAPDRFLAEMYAARPDLRGQVDAVGIHPYAASTGGVIRLIAAMRRVLDERGEASVPIDVTELGWSTVAGESYLNASDGERGARLAWLARHLPRSDCGVERFMPHTWVTGELDPANGDDWFGLYHRDATPSESGRAYTDAAREMAAEDAIEVTEALCRRTPRVEVRPAAGRTRTRCYRSSVRLRGAALGGAKVRFTQRVGRRRTTVARRSDHRGRVRHCFRRGSNPRNVRVVASHPELARRATASSRSFAPQGR